MDTPFTSSTADASAPLTILLIEDSPTDVLFVREAFRAVSRPAIELRVVDRLSAGLNVLGTQPIDAVVLDLNLPDSRGSETLDRLRGSFPDIPLVVLTGDTNLAGAARVLQRGVQDYLVKDVNIGPSLVRSVRFAIERHRFTALLERQARELRESESALRSVIEADRDALLIIEDSGQVRFANSAARELFETPALAEPGGLRLPVALELPAEQEFARRDGTRCIVEPRSSALAWDGRPAHLVSLRDVTQRKLAEEAAERARASQIQMKDRFLSHISHELRTPLAVVREFLALLDERVAGDLNSEQSEYVGIMLRNADELNRMIEDLLEVTRAQSGRLSVEPAHIPFVPWFTHSVAPLARLARRRGLTLESRIPASLPDVVADPLRGVQVLENLVGNAIKFTPAGGRIEVSARALLGEREPAAGERPDRVECIVSDNGPGIPPEHLERIFEELHQVGTLVDEGRRGLGMGLYLARQLVERMGGRITVASTPGVGTTFRFTLPVHDRTRRIHELLAGAGVRHSPVHLLVVQLQCSPGGHFAPGDDAVCRRAYLTVQACLPSGTSWLLPREWKPTEGHEPMVAVIVGARAEAERCRVLALEGLAACGGLTASGLECEARVVTYPETTSGADGVGPDGQAGFVRRIESGIDEVMSGMGGVRS